MRQLTRSFLPLLFVMAGQSYAGTSTEVLKSTQGWNGLPLPGFTMGKPEMRVLRFKLAPGDKTAVHLHPVNGAGYMIAGELTMHATSDAHGSFSDPNLVKDITFRAGDAWVEVVNTWHYGENKGSSDAEFVLVFADSEGIPPTLSLSAAAKDH